MSRYFLAYNGGTAVGKNVFDGDNSTIDSLISQFSSSHPNLTVQEVDSTTFNSTNCPAIPNAAQSIWAALPFQTSPTATTAFQAIHVLAKYLGLE